MSSTDVLIYVDVTSNKQSIFSSQIRTPSFPKNWPSLVSTARSPIILENSDLINLRTNTIQIRVCSFRRIQKRIFDPRFARLRGRKEREIRNWICNLGNLSPTIFTTASQKITCFLLFDKLCDYTVQNLVVGSSNSDEGTYKTDKERSALKLKII